MFPFVTDNKSDSKAISELKDPFSKDGVERISIELCKSTSLFRDGKRHKAVVHFTNGATSGEHKICEDDHKILFQRIQTLINSL